MITKLKETIQKAKKYYEAVNDYNLYHFTDLDSLFEILKDGSLYPSYDKYSGDGVSLTRNKNLKWTSGEIRLTFDKRELSTRYKIVPLHWFNIRHNWENKKDYRATGPATKPFTGQNIPANQDEERLLSEKPIPVKYIKEITFIKKVKPTEISKLKSMTDISIKMI